MKSLIWALCYRFFETIFELTLLTLTRSGACHIRIKQWWIIDLSRLKQRRERQLFNVILMDVIRLLHYVLFLFSFPPQSLFSGGQEAVSL